MFTFNILALLTPEGTMQYNDVIHKKFRTYKNINS